MRPIDADELENDVRKVLRKRHSKRTILALYMMLDIIRGRDTIAVSPVRHGKWYKSYNILFSVRCSACDCYSPDKTPYCSYCGAKMDGGNEND